MSDKTGSDMLKLGVLWKRTTRQGNRPFLAGPVCGEAIEAAVALLRQGGRFLVLANQHKRDGKNDPDCTLFVVPDRPPGGRGS